MGCSAEKLAAPARAKDVYTSTRFRNARKVAERGAQGWFVLSGKHGLLAPDDVVEPYDLDLGRLSPAERSLWAGRVAEQIASKVPTRRRITILADENYSRPLVPLLRELGYEVEEA